VQHSKKKFNFFISVSFRSSDNFKVRQSSIIAFVFFITLDRSLIIDVSCKWLAYLSLKNKSSKIINYRGNRFNNLFTGAVATLYHSEDMIDFISGRASLPMEWLCFAKSFNDFVISL
jgi:hypothetical protein